jgi:hypothetical protein
MKLMTADETTELVDSLSIAKPPAGAADSTKLMWLQTHLLAQVSLQLSYYLAAYGIFPPLDPPGSNTTLGKQ